VAMKAAMLVAMLAAMQAAMQAAMLAAMQAAMLVVTLAAMQALEATHQVPLTTQARAARAEAAAAAAEAPRGDRPSAPNLQAAAAVVVEEAEAPVLVLVTPLAILLAIPLAAPAPTMARAPLLLPREDRRSAPRVQAEAAQAVADLRLRPAADPGLSRAMTTGAPLQALALATAPALGSSALPLAALRTKAARGCCALPPCGPCGPRLIQQLSPRSVPRTRPLLCSLQRQLLHCFPPPGPRASTRRARL
jgi:hypothetical protein